MAVWCWLASTVNKRKAKVFAQRMVRGLDPKNALAVDVATIKATVIHCHVNDIPVPESIDGLYLVKVLQLMIKKNLTSNVS